MVWQYFVLKGKKGDDGEALLQSVGVVDPAMNGSCARCKDRKDFGDRGWFR